MNSFKLQIILSLSAVFSIGCGAPPSNNSTASAQNATVAVNASPQQNAATDEIAESRTLYKINCAKCHKEDGTGGKVSIEDVVVNADNLTTEKMKKMSDAKYIDYIENGVPGEGMPAFKGRLTEKQIKDIVKYIRTELQKP